MGFLQQLLKLSPVIINLGNGLEDGRAKAKTMEGPQRLVWPKLIRFFKSQMGLRQVFHLGECLTCVEGIFPTARFVAKGPLETNRRSL